MALGSSMWGGRRPEDVGEPRTIHAVDNEPLEPTGSEETTIPVRGLLSLSLVILGAVLLSVGLGLIFGVGGALSGAGLAAIAVGIILGMGDET